MLLLFDPLLDDPLFDTEPHFHPDGTRTLPARRGFPYSLRDAGL